MHPRSRLLTRLLVLAFAACVVVSAPAAAGELIPNGPDTSGGKPGRYIDRDDDNHPAICRYDVDGKLIGFRAAAPLAWARTGRTKQRIGLQMVIESWSGSAWVKWQATPWAYQSATPVKPTTFTPRVLDRDLADPAFGPFRFRMNLRWYAKDGRTINGRVSLWRDMLARRSSTGETIPHDSTSCPVS